MSIDTARELAAVIRQDLARARLGVGPDPLEARRRRKDEARAATQAARNAPKAKTFRECAIAYIATQAPAWGSAKHARQWTATLEDYVYPLIGDRPVDAVDQTAVIDILTPIWNDEAGDGVSRVRGRIESVLGWATVAGFRSGDNPAAWRGRLQHVFPARTKIRARRASRGDALQGGARLHGEAPQPRHHVEPGAPVHHPHRRQDRRDQRRQVERDRSPGEALDRPRLPG